MPIYRSRPNGAGSRRNSPTSAHMTKPSPAPIQARGVIRLTENSAANPSSAPNMSPALQSSGRLALFVQDNCTACIQRVRDLQHAEKEFDLYFVGSQNDAERVRHWAILAGIDPKKVRSKQITLNHDEGRWMALGLGGALPALVQEVNGRWQRL